MPNLISYDDAINWLLEKKADLNAAQRIDLYRNNWGLLRISFVADMFKIGDIEIVKRDCAKARDKANGRIELE